MVWISCPWCEDEGLADLLEPVEPVEPVDSFTCESCGTCVTFAPTCHPAQLDLAA
jgi:hypothetical protein